MPNYFKHKDKPKKIHDMLYAQEKRKEDKERRDKEIKQYLEKEKIKNQQDDNYEIRISSFKDWASQNLIMSESFESDINSNRLKNAYNLSVEKELYVNGDDVKEAMKDLGYKIENEEQTISLFNVYFK